VVTIPVVHPVQKGTENVEPASIGGIGAGLQRVLDRLVRRDQRGGAGTGRALLVGSTKSPGLGSIGGDNGSIQCERRTDGAFPNLAA
jgi:hypothetical protein